ncbi:hypothetical protein V6N11_069657 [Hibiscus sabdariffa]
MCCLVVCYGIYGEKGMSGYSVLQRSSRMLHEATAGRSSLGAIRPLSCTGANVLDHWVKPPQGRVVIMWVISGVAKHKGTEDQFQSS